MHCARPGELHSLSLTRIKFYPPTGHITHQSCRCNGYDTLQQQLKRLGIAQQLAKWSHRQNRKKLIRLLPMCTGRTITDPKHCPALHLIPF